MRFAYVDSQGNEVSIPGVDALALRIELGAIGPDTELYDASADRWGPAHTHEIFHTLSRELEAEGFVAPPPPRPSERPAKEVEKAAEVEQPSAPAHGTSAEKESEPVAESADASEGESNAEPDLKFDLVDGFAIEDVAEEEEAGAVPPSDTAPGQGPPGQGGVPESGGEVGGEEPMDVSPGRDPWGEPEPEGMTEAADARGFDFDGLDSLESDEGAAKGSGGDEAPPESGHGMVLEEPLGGAMDFSVAAEDRGGGLELEQPWSDFDPTTPPPWMEQEAPEREDVEVERVLDLAQPSEGGDEAKIPPRRPAEGAGAGRGTTGPDRGRREPRERPSPPRRPKKGGLVRAVVGIVVLVAVGVGGWYGWSAYRARAQAQREEAQRQAARPPVVIPEIPDGLLPTMRTLGRDALAGMIAQFDSERVAFGLPEQPRSDWLAGVYLANASRYPEIQRYWVAIDSFVDHLRATDARAFHRQYVAQLERARISGDTASMLLERADSGFLATREARREAYNQMGDLVNAALDLHQFLLDNEDQIAYEPAAGGVSRDPVLEAVPSSRELGDRMWNMVDGIVGALDTLGTLDKVTTQRLFAVLFERIRQAGFD